MQVEDTRWRMDVFKADVRALKAAEEEKDKQVYDASKNLKTSYASTLRPHTHVP